MDRLQQEWSNHKNFMAGLPPVIKPVLNFFDQMRSPKDHKNFMAWTNESTHTFKEMMELMRNSPGIHKLTHITYNTYTARSLGFPEFTYGFRYKIDDGETFKHLILFMGNGILARRADGDQPLIEIRKDEPPLLHLTQNFAFIITKRKDISEIDLYPEEPDQVYAAWQPEVSHIPRAIRVNEDVAIPWKNSREEVEVFTDTEDVPNLEYH